MNTLNAIVADIVAMAQPALFNLYFAAVSVPIALGLATLLALGKASRNRVVSGLCRIYIYAFRGSPLFIQLFAIYAIALAFNLSVWKPLGIDGFVLHPLFLGPLVLILNTTAYTAEIFYGALLAVPIGEVDAARAFGMSGRQRFRAVVWPHLIRLAWPAYTNEVVFLFQATALIYFTLPVVGGQADVMNTAQTLFRRDYNVFLHYGVAALYFLAISLAIFYLFSLVYGRLMRHRPKTKLRFALRREAH